MNLGQAVAVCLYELATRLTAPVKPPASAGKRLRTRAPLGGALSGDVARSADMDRLAGVIDQVMEAASYSPASMREANRHDLRLLLRRLALTSPDVRRALGLFRRILRHLER
jgi:tRNA C32,U32 (ribose-2'-O)-methylase TrmJ